ncbi:hypothetical protein RHGRI_031096 [Rhododendron griersonianum]|uniref:ATP-dependent DNA helicase n=1 Tax=Rhododendron griersonianum TaxID=479676 RepID=A0AAV6IB71_9ERIC|nr:hypothetical protein RHGRI_031096 [Rhododendron griersonianum]
MLVFCGALNPKELLLKFEEPLTEDYVKRQKMLPVEARQCLLRFVKSTLEGMGKTLQDFGFADLFENEIEHDLVCREILEEQNINVSEIDLLSISKLNAEQLKAYNEIMQAVRKNNGTCFFIDGLGGKGKTFLYRAILVAVRSARSIALATATSGVAASILPNGRTAHSRFKIPLDKDGKLSCNVGKQTGLAKLLRATSLIIWDEASMAKRLICRALHKHVIVAQIAVGEHQGDIVFISRISLQPTDVKLYPVQFTRRRFPLRLCFAMTINKAQGQTLDTVGVNLQQPVFSHGQLYVALSPATIAARIKVILNAFYDGKEEPTSAKNIVYREILSETHSNPKARDLNLATVSHYSSLNYGRDIMDDNERERGNDELDGEGNGGGKRLPNSNLGTRVQCTIWNADIQVLKDTLQLYHSYTISNAKVEVTPSDYRIVDDPLQWTFSSRTPIEEIPDAIYNIRDIKYQFVELQDLNEYVRDTHGFDVIFAILHVGPKRTTKDNSTIQNITIIDASKVPTTLVLWEQFAEHEGEIMGTLEGPFPIVQGTRMKVSTYLGYQLMTRGSSTFSFNPPIPSAEKLRKC